MAVATHRTPSLPRRHARPHLDLARQGAGVQIRHTMSNQEVLQQGISIQAMEIISSWVFCFLACAVMFSSLMVIESSIQASPHWVQTNAGTFRTTTTPDVRSTVNVVVPASTFPLHMGHWDGICCILFSFCLKVRFENSRVRFINSYHKNLLCRFIKRCYYVNRTVSRKSQK